MRYYIIAGEASGDMHGANLMKSLKAKDPEADFRFWGGDKMLAVGGTMVMHYRETAYMGFVEVAKNLPSIFRNLKFCKEDISSYGPDALILIDYPGFNIRIAEWASGKLSQQSRVMYYISPQVWAWKAKRAIKLKQSVDRMFVILPFEKSFYKQYDFDVTYVGHPLLDELIHVEKDQTFLNRHDLDPNRKIVALLPGSRKQEVESHLETMLGLVDTFSDLDFVIAGVPSLDIRLYQKLMPGSSENTYLVMDETRSLLQHADAAVVASGTATLETAMFKVPQVVGYRGGFLSYQIARHLINIKYISLVNLIAEQELVKELVQNEFTTENLGAELKNILQSDHRHRIIQGYESLYQKLGGPGASDHTADEIVQDLRSKK